MALNVVDSRGNRSALYIKATNIEDGDIFWTLYNNEYESGFTIDYPLPLVEKLENYTQSKIYLFKNRFRSKEDHCFSITIDEKRSGVLFPIKIYKDYTVLSSPGVDKGLDFFYRFLHIAFYHLIDGKGIVSGSLNHSNVSSSSTLSIGDLYDDETVIFLYHTGEVNPELDIQYCYPFLLKLGYVPIIKEMDNYEVEMFDVVPEKHPLYSYGLLDTVNVKVANKSIIDEKFVSHFFGSMIKSTLTPLSRFILLYQIIELLIDKLALEYYKKNSPFTSTLSILMLKADQAKSYRDAFDYLYEIGQRINQSTESIRKEDKRINKLFNDKCKLDVDDYAQFAALSKILIGHRAVSTLTEYVYQLRNRIIHDYHNLSIEHEDINTLLQDVNIEFEQIVADIVIKYSD